MTDNRSYYETLNVAQTSDFQDIKKAFHRLSKLLHPDITSLPVDEAARKFRQVYEAYEILSDPVKRKLYDTTVQTMKKSYWKGLGEDRKVSFKTVVNTGNRRPLSGGELFSLTLLCIAICISLLLGIIFAVLNGRELYVRPSWLLNTNQSFAYETSHKTRHDNFASIKYTIKPTLFRRS